MIVGMNTIDMKMEAKPLSESLMDEGLATPGQEDTKVREGISCQMMIIVKEMILI